MKPYRADVIGSMLRPDYLLRARAAYASGKLGEADFKRIEDRAVDECIAIQESSGVDILADGEMRRNVFSSQLAEAAEGFGAVENNMVDWFTLEGEIETSPVTVGVTERIRMLRNLSAEEFVYLRARFDGPAKMTLPSPTMYAYYWVPGVSEAAYATVEDYMAHVTEILADEVAELVRLGCEYIQFDAPEFGMLLDDHQKEWFRAKGFRPEYMVHDGIDMLNGIIDAHPETVFGLHICRGNDANRYMAAGGYGEFARDLFARTRAQRLLLEYDDERSGDFAPLAEVPDDKLVVLGLITTKYPRQESQEEVQGRVGEAARYIGMERLALSTQCGFASVAKGNNLGFDLQKTKLSLVARAARALWPD
ncbi:MAG: cobalamin-independent methionine synthase II family protein [Alphaproteobacteria bacterium]|nr:cobalamin-independent methionine synthase II family protein [Alphaproteobacteria bacterium]